MIFLFYLRFKFYKMRQILFCGDLHGNFAHIKSEIERKKIGNEDDPTYFIQVGDFGVGFAPLKTEQETLLHLNKFFKLRNIICLVIRGNHDNPNFFKGNHIFSNLKLLEDYTVMDIYDKRYLFVGGAISVDRIDRILSDKKSKEYGTNRESYWIDENFILDEEKLRDIIGVNVVVSHSSPDYCFPDNRNGFSKIVDHYAQKDSSLYKDIMEERSNISKMMNILIKNKKVKK